MSGIIDALWITGSYIVVFIIIYLIINFLTKGFFHQYMRVKISRGRLILVECHDVTDTYYKGGFIDSKRNLVVKDRYKKIHTFSNMEKKYIGRNLGVNLIAVDLQRGLVIEKDFSGSSAFDLTMLDELVNRALMLPRLKKDDKLEALKWVLLILILAGVGICIYMISQQPETVCKIASDGVNI